MPVAAQRFQMGFGRQASLGGQVNLAGRLFNRTKFNQRKTKSNRQAKSHGLRAGVFFESLESRDLLASFVPSQDNTLYQDPEGDVSNGIGANLIAGSIDSTTNNLRRALVRFDLSPLAAGTIVTDARLDLTVTRDPMGATPRHNFSIHRVDQAWGERGSLVLGAGGMGVPAMNGDATWLHTAFSTATWTTPGGDFQATPTATTSVGDSGTVASWTSPTLIADVQSWINDGTNNFGWILVGEEGTQKTARRFSSREGIATPVLEVTVAAPGPQVSLEIDREIIEEESGEAIITATMSESVQDDVIIQFGFSGTATLGTDYVTTGTSIVIPGGGTEGTITITTEDDILSEGDETVIVEILSVSGANELGQQQVMTTITDGEGGPVVPNVTLGVDSAAILETGGVAIFTATLSAATTVPVTVDLNFSGTATPTADYTISATQIIVAPGTTSGSITVAAALDDEDEPDETVVVDIANVTGGVESGIQQQTTTITDDDEVLSFTVSSLLPTSTGFVAELSADVDASVLNLYDSKLGDPDAVLSGAATGPVTGSLVVDSGLRTVTFIKTGDPLPADTYSVRLRSADDGFKDLAGNLLDGDGDGTGGDDFAESFVVSAATPGTVTLSLPDFVRGGGQDVHIPADTSNGVPLLIGISEGTSVRSVDLRIGYDPTLLDFTSATIGAEMPAGSFVALIDDTPGLAILAVRSTSDLPSGTNVLVNLQAMVPAADIGDTYNRQEVLDVHGVTVSDGLDTEFPVVDDDAVHLASYFADVTGNRRVNAADASEVAQFAALLENGFGAGDQRSDPFIVADMSGNGRINAGDASLLARFAALLDVPEIPPLPSGLVVTTDPTNPPAELPGLPTPRDLGNQFFVGSPDSVSDSREATDSGTETTFQVIETFSSSAGAEPREIERLAVDAAILELTDGSQQLADEELIDGVLASHA